MSINMLIEQTPEPRTIQSITEDLHRLGISGGMTLIAFFTRLGLRRCFRRRTGIAQRNRGTGHPHDASKLLGLLGPRKLDTPSCSEDLVPSHTGQYAPIRPAYDADLTHGENRRVLSNLAGNPTE